VGSFYARFRGKDDLLDYLGERLWSEALERWNALLGSQDWSAFELSGLVRASVGLLVDAQRSRSAYLRAIDRVAGARQNAYGRFRDEVVDGVIELLMHRRAEIVHDVPERAVWIGLRAVVGVIDADARESSRLERQQIVDECSTLLYGYLSGGAGDVGAGHSPDFFDVWG
jgi:AcrR family transcriptional regulator